MPDAYQADAYQVDCQRCRVSFPVGTKRCLHCGEKLGGGQGLRFAPDAPSGLDDTVLDDELPSRPGGLSPMTLVWVLLLLGGYLYRSC